MPRSLMYRLDPCLQDRVRGLDFHFEKFHFDASLDNWLGRSGTVSQCSRHFRLTARPLSVEELPCAKLPPPIKSPLKRSARTSTASRSLKKGDIFFHIGSALRIIAKTLFNFSTGIGSSRTAMGASKKFVAPESLASNLNSRPEKRSSTRVSARFPQLRVP